MNWKVFAALFIALAEVSRRKPYVGGDSSARAVYPPPPGAARK